MSYSVPISPLGMNTTTPLVCGAGYHRRCPSEALLPPGPDGTLPIDYDKCRCTACSDPEAWIKAQKACNDSPFGPNTEWTGKAWPNDPNNPCVIAQANMSVSPCDYSPYQTERSCPKGSTVLSEVIAVRKTKAPFTWGTWTVNHCVSPFSPRLAAQNATRNWGLLIGLGLAAVVVYKVAF